MVTDLPYYMANPKEIGHFLSAFSYIQFRFFAYCLCTFGITSDFGYHTLSTLVLNSRDRYEKKWQPNFTRLKTRLRISNI